jgi:hypothetical protein
MGFLAFRPVYGGFTIALLLVGVWIAVRIDDPLIRPYVGDSLAVMLIHTGLRAVTRLSVPVSIAMALAIAFAIEIGQWFRFVDAIGLGKYRVARIVLGTGFDPREFLAYPAGALLMPVAETACRRAP